MNRITLLKSMFALVLLAVLPSMTTAATETIAWIHTDHLGSPIAGRNAAGETTWEQAYAPWGEKQAVAGVPEAPAGVSYTGHVYDEQVGLIYAEARWYDPKVGRFLSPDSVRFAADDTTSFNRYAYVGNDPLSWIDPDGNMKRDITGNRSGDSAKILEGGGIFVPQGSYRTLVPSPSRAPAIRGREAVSEAPGAVPPTGLIPRSGPATTNRAPDFIVTPGGTVFPVPRNATGPSPVVNSGGKTTGSAFTGGSGGANGQVDTIRIMAPTPPRGNSPAYPNGYIKYENKSGQGVDPYSGRTIPNADSHFPID